ncbi:MAG: hypothetical protein H7256_03315 [Bdellovibrio sp.]|nr:hypothetical protein [Bdellovibrio sp.]
MSFVKRYLPLFNAALFISLSVQPVRASEAFTKRDAVIVDPLISKKIGSSDSASLDFVRRFLTVASSSLCQGESKAVYCNLESVGLFDAKESLENYKPKNEAEKKELAILKKQVGRYLAHTLNSQFSLMNKLCNQNQSAEILDHDWVIDKIDYLNSVNTSFFDDKKLRSEVDDQKKLTLACLNKLNKKPQDQALKEKCLRSANDLSSSFPAKKHQTTLPWCYAYAAADLLSFYEQIEVSATDVAVTDFNQRVQSGRADSNQLLDRGGTMSSALATVAEKGYCLEKDAPSEFKNLNSKLNSALDLYSEIGFFQKASQKYPEHAKAFCKQSYDRIGKKMFPNVDMNSFGQIFKSDFGSKMASRLSAGNCGQKRVVAKNKEWSTTCDTPIEKTVDTALNLLGLKQPFGVALPADALEFGYQGQARADHAVLAVGARWNDELKRCEIKVRDSSNDRLPEWVGIVDVLGGAKCLTFKSGVL